MVRFSFNPEINAFETHASDILVVDDIKQHYKFLSEQPVRYIGNTKVLINCTQVTVEIDPADLNQTIDLVKLAVLKHETLKEAIIVDTPHQTAIASLFESLSSEITNYTVKIFSTTDAAIGWLTSQ